MSKPAAEIIIRNGRVITLDAEDRIAQALAVAQGRIVAVGRNDDMMPLTGLDTRIIDARGRAVIPGLIDGHAHMDREGLKEQLPSLAGCRSIVDIQDRIRELAARRKPGEWIVTMPIGEPPDFRGVPESLAEGRWPNRHDLDAAAPDNPVYIRAIWGYWRHTLPLVSIANTAALRAAGVTRSSTPPVDTVSIEKDASGTPTGTFIEQNFMPIVEFTLMGAAPRFGAGDREMALARSMQIYNGFGTTGVYEGHGVAAEVLDAYKAQRCRGPLPVRSHLVLSPKWDRSDTETVKGVLEEWLSWLSRQGMGDDYLRVQGIYAESGVTDENRKRAEAGGHYTGWAGFYYDSGLPQVQLRVLVEEAARNGIRVSGIGAQMLPLYQAANAVAPIGGARWVVEHISWFGPEQIAAARDLGLVVTTHTNRYIWKEGPMLLQNTGTNEPEWLVPMRSLAEAGVTVSLATDNVPPSLFHPISQVIARKGRDGSDVVPEQGLTPMEALRCASTNGAYLCFAEDRRGRLAPGFDADLAIIDTDPLNSAPTELAEATADVTLVGGRIVHERPGIATAKTL